jgi:hypothetical protein
MTKLDSRRVGRGEREGDVTYNTHIPYITNLDHMIDNSTDPI